MNAGLDAIRRQCNRPADAVRWACILEATAPKVGNVYPGREFRDLTYSDFVTAAELSATVFESPPDSFSHAVLKACESVAEKLHTNVNLGILLLLGPLVCADSSGDSPRLDRSTMQTRVAGVLAAMTPDDSKRLYAAINVASPGGMGESDEMDLAGPPPADFLAAMRSAASRDRIAMNYADEFRDLLETVVPLVADSVESENDLLSGVAVAHLRLLADRPDSLIARKFGDQVASQVQQQARFDHSDFDKREDFDRELRSGAVDLQGRRSKINPGTTADLIAAALYVLLRENGSRPAEPASPSQEE